MTGEVGGCGGVPAQSVYRFPPPVHISKYSVGVLKCLLRRVARCFSLRNACCIIARMGTGTCGGWGVGSGGGQRCVVRDDNTRVYLSSSPLPLRQRGGGFSCVEATLVEKFLNGNGTRSSSFHSAAFIGELDEEKDIKLDSERRENGES